MSDLAITSHGTILRMGAGDAVTVPAASDVFADVAELLDQDGPELMQNMIDTSAHNDDFESVVPGGITRTGSMSFDINYIPTNATHDDATGLQAALRDKVKKNWQVEYPDGSLASFTGYVERFKPKAPVDGVLKASVAVKPTSDIVIT